MNHESATVRMFPPLAHETRSAVETECAAFHLNRRPQTLRLWACQANGPIRPIHVHGRLAWKVADIQAVLNGEIAHGDSDCET